MEKASIVLIHGWGGSRESLRGLSELLEEQGFKTTLLEYPGHGQTPEMSLAWKMEDFVAWLKQELNRLKVDEKNLVLVGHSFGGKIIIGACTEKIIDPKKIVLINSNGIKARNSAKKKVWSTLSQLKGLIDWIPGFERFRYYIYKIFIGELDYLNTNNNTNLRETFRNIIEEHYDEKIGQITQPTLLIWGERDNATPLWMGQRMNEEIADSILVTFNETHGLPLKQPEPVAKEIIKFIQDDRNSSN